jgi:hypothetical protein
MFADGNVVEIANVAGEAMWVKCCCHEKTDECKIAKVPQNNTHWYGRSLKSRFADLYSQAEGCGRLMGSSWHNYRHKLIKDKRCTLSSLDAEEFRKDLYRKEKRDRMRKVCDLSASDYRASPVCSQANIDAWKNKRESQVSSDAEQCKYDESSGSLSCGYEASCGGGDELFGGIVIRELTVTFDCKECDKQAGGVLLRPGCCDTCASLQSKASSKQLTWKGQKPDKVICNGCDSQSLTTLTRDNSKNCRFYGNKFKCETKASCKIGQGLEKVTDNSYTCRVTPCDRCQNDALKAECCSECLKNACSCNNADSAHQMFVCTGCEHPSWASWFR